MSRTEKMFQIVQILRSRKLTTAAYLAERLQVSERTIYRYVTDLSLSGIPIISEAGRGYWLDEQFNMPPLMLSQEELIALSLGARLVKASADQALADSAQQLIDKVEAVVPRHLAPLLAQMQLHAPRYLVSSDEKQRLQECREALAKRTKIRLAYKDLKGQASQRIVWPLAVAFWGRHWTLAAWCEMREDFRAFRLDGVTQLECLADVYPEQPGRQLQDFVRIQPPPDVD